MIDAIPATTKLKKAIRHPLRAIIWLLEKARLSRLNEASERDLLLRFLSDVFHADTRVILEKYERSGFRGWMEHRHAQLREFPGPYRLGSTPEFDCETIYFLVRALKPNVVVETGVCYGASSAYILEALKENRRGALYSIDLGNNPDEPPSDFFIPPRLRDRWHLIVGDSKQELPRLLARLGRIDLFHHDSLHTPEHMMWEYKTAFPHLGPAGVLSSHDVRAVLSLQRPFQRNPFAVFCERNELYFVESYNVGVAVSDRLAHAQSAEVARIAERFPPTAARRYH